MENDQLVMERPERTRAPVAASCSVKTILLHLQDDPSVERRLESALALSRACSAHLSCVHIVPIQAYVAFDSFGGVFVMKDVIRAIDEQATELRERIGARLRSEDVSWDYTEVTGDVATSIVSRAALADLIVVGRDSHRHDFEGASTTLIGELLHRSRSPLFIPGDEQAQRAENALIAWNGSYEAANAVRASLGLLKLASSVHVLQMVDEEKKGIFPNTALLEYLSRHGVHAELSVIEAGVDVRDENVISATIVARAKALNAGYIVMGGYGHSRVGEYIFGGVTRTLLKRCPVSLLVAH